MITMKGVGSGLDPSLVLRTGAIIPFGSRGIRLVREGQVVHQVERLGGRLKQRRFEVHAVSAPPGATGAHVQAAKAAAAKMAQAAGRIADAMEAGMLGDDQQLNVPHAVPCPSVGTLPGVLCETAKLFIQGRPVIGSFYGVRVAVTPVYHYPGSKAYAVPPGGLADPFDDGLGDALGRARSVTARRKAAGGVFRSERGGRGRRVARGRGRGISRGRRIRGRGGAISVTPISQETKPPVMPTPPLPGTEPAAVPGATQPVMPTPGSLSPLTPSAPGGMFTTPMNIPPGAAYVPPPGGAWAPTGPSMRPGMPGGAPTGPQQPTCPPGYALGPGGSCLSPVRGQPSVPATCPPGTQPTRDRFGLTVRCDPFATPSGGLPGFPPAMPPGGFPGGMPGLPSPQMVPDAAGMLRPACPPGFVLGPGGASCAPSMMPGLPGSGGMPGEAPPPMAPPPGGGAPGAAPPPPPGAALPPPPSAADEDEFDEDEGGGGFDEEEDMEGAAGAPYGNPFYG
jgi:hypothetical protein